MYLWDSDSYSWIIFKSGDMERYWPTGLNSNANNSSKRKITVSWEKKKKIDSF